MKRKMFLGVAVAIILYGLIVGMSVASASVNHTQEEAVNWILGLVDNGWGSLDNTINYDGSEWIVGDYGEPQCVDLIAAYQDYLIGWHINLPNAFTFANAVLPEGLAYSSDPHPGDIVVFNWSQFGHIGVIYEVNEDGTYNYVDTNGGGYSSYDEYGRLINAPATRRGPTNEGYAFIHPDFIEPPPTSSVPEVQEDDSGSSDNEDSGEDLGDDTPQVSSDTDSGYSGGGGGGGGGDGWGDETLQDSSDSDSGYSGGGGGGGGWGDENPQETIIFGKWEQDGNKDNGKEPLEWQVLYSEGSAKLIITDKIIDAYTFGNMFIGKWNNSKLRSWLNGSFLQDAFSEKERSYIALRDQLNLANSYILYGTYSSETSSDLIFVLSETEARQLFDSDESRQAAVTAYAKKQGAPADKNGYGEWWLRTVGSIMGMAQYVKRDGEIENWGTNPGSKNGVRPALWIDGDFVPDTTGNKDHSSTPSTPADEPVQEDHTSCGESGTQTQESGGNSDSSGTQPQPPADASDTSGTQSQTPGDTSDTSGSTTSNSNADVFDLEHFARFLRDDSNVSYHNNHLLQHIGSKNCTISRDSISMEDVIGSDYDCGYLVPGDTFTVDEIDGYHVKITIIRHAENGSHSGYLTGWIDANYLECPCSKAEYYNGPVRNYYHIGEAVKNGVNLREETSKDSGLVATLNKGDRVEILSEYDGKDKMWYRCRYEGKMGYIRNDMLKIIERNIPEDMTVSAVAPAEPAGPITDPSEVTDSSSGQETNQENAIWQKVYHDFILGKQYMLKKDPSDVAIYQDAFGNYYDINEYQVVSFGLYDWDQDGTPELFADNGSPDTGWSATIVYTCSFEGELESLGILANRAGGPWLTVDEEYEGVLTSSGNIGSFTTIYSTLLMTSAISEDVVYHESFNNDEGVTVLEEPVVTVYDRELYESIKKYGVILLTPFEVTNLSESNWEDFVASVITDRSGFEPIMIVRDGEEKQGTEVKDAADSINTGDQESDGIGGQNPDDQEPQNTWTPDDPEYWQYLWEYYGIPEGFLDADISSTSASYTAGIPVTINISINGGVAPFNVHWYLDEAVSGSERKLEEHWSMLDYLGSYGDYTTNDNNSSFEVLLPLQGNAVNVHVDIQDGERRISNIDEIVLNSASLGDDGQSDTDASDSFEGVSFMNWKTAYRQFMISDAYNDYLHCSVPEFEDAFNDRQNSRSEVFALHDINLDGVPELIIESLYGIEQCDVFTFESSTVKWLGTMGGDNFINDVFYFNDLDYLALFSSEGGPGHTVDMYSVGTSGLVKTHVGATDLNSEGEIIGFHMSISDDKLAGYMTAFIVNYPPEKGRLLNWARLEDLQNDTEWNTFFASATAQTDELNQNNSENGNNGQANDSQNESKGQILFYAETTKETRIRESVSKNSNLVTTIKEQGVEVAVLEQMIGDDGFVWYRVQLQDGTVGYARSDFFKKIEKTENENSSDTAADSEQQEANNDFYKNNLDQYLTWEECYRRYLLGKQFLATHVNSEHDEHYEDPFGAVYYFNSDSNYSDTSALFWFALHDMDRNGIPELIAANGATKGYIYTVKNGKMVLMGDMGIDPVYCYHFGNDQYPGIVVMYIYKEENAASYISIDSEGNLLKEIITESYYGDLATDIYLTQNGIEDINLDGFEGEIHNETSDKTLLNMYENNNNQKELYYLFYPQIDSLNWDAFIKGYMNVDQVGNTEQNEGSLPSDWREAYEEFVLGEGFKTSGQKYYYGEEDGICFTLFDLDRDGIPEILIFDGRYERQFATTYVYTFSPQTGVTFVDEIFRNDDCIGESINQNKNETYYGLYEMLFESNYIRRFTMKDGKIITQDYPDESNNIEYEDGGYKRWYSLEMIRKMGWENFISGAPSVLELIDFAYLNLPEHYKYGEQIEVVYEITGGDAPYEVDYSWYAFNEPDSDITLEHDVYVTDDPIITFKYTPLIHADKLVLVVNVDDLYFRYNYRAYNYTEFTEIKDSQVPGSQSSSQMLFNAVTTKETRVRESANKNSALVTTISQGEGVAVLEQITGADGMVWYRVQLQNGMIGYARSDFFEKTVSHGSKKNTTDTSVESGQSDISEDNTFVSDGSYLSYGFPVDIYCSKKIYTPGEPVTVSADILGGTGPFSIEWYVTAYGDGWGNFNEPENPFKVYMDTHPELQNDMKYVTRDRHVELTINPPMECGTLDFSLYVTDANGEESDDSGPNGTNDRVTLYSKEEWQSVFPDADYPNPTLIGFPFMAETTLNQIEVKAWCGNDYDTITVLSPHGTQIEVVGQEYDDNGQKWFIVRPDFWQTGYVRSDLLAIAGQTDNNAAPQFIAEGQNSIRWIPTDVYSDKYVYHAGEPVTLTADILAGTPPFEISWYVGESIIRAWSSLDEYLESHPDYPMSVSYTTDSRHVEFVYTPPVDSEGFGVYLSVKDANGIGNYRWIDGGDREPNLWVYAPNEVNTSSLQEIENLTERLPIMAETSRDNIVLTNPWGKQTTIPRQGTPVKIIGVISNYSSDEISYVVRYDYESFGNLPSDAVCIPDLAALSAESTATLAPLPQISVEPGSTISIGHYEQDNNFDNGPEPVEWIVLEAQGNRYMLISKYGLDVVPYNKEKKSVTWETCSLRNWLNNDFLYSAFTSEERNAILLAEVDNDRFQCYAKWDTKGGNNTQDYLFLLSYDEASYYFDLSHDSNSDNIQAKCAPTAYAIQKGVYIPPEVTIGTAEGKRAGSWWLRSPGKKQDTAAGVGGHGRLGYDNVNTNDNAVRPCFWLDLNSDNAK